MRELNECTAEVFRRSEKRIKERRKRRSHILVWCIPLALCVAVLGAAVFPWQDAPNGSDMTQELAGVNGSSVFLRVSGEGVHNEIIDSAQVKELYIQIYLLFSTDGPSAGSDVYKGIGDFPIRPPESDVYYSSGDLPIRLPDEGPDHGEGYIIIFFGPAGEEEYTLIGGQLYNEQTGQTAELTDGQLERLKIGLGLMEQ